MEHILILVLLINHETMEIIPTDYPTLAVCEAEKQKIKTDVETLNQYVYPIKVVSAACVPHSLIDKD